MDTSIYWQLTDGNEFFGEAKQFASESELEAAQQKATNDTGGNLYWQIMPGQGGCGIDFQP